MASAVQMVYGKEYAVHFDFVRAPTKPRLPSGEIRARLSPSGLQDRRRVDLSVDHRTYRPNLEIVKARNERVGLMLDVMA